MVELLFWICFFLLGLDIKIEKGVYLMTDWIVLVIQFRVISRLVLSWLVSDMLEVFFRTFLDHNLPQYRHHHRIHVSSLLLLLS